MNRINIKEVDSGKVWRYSGGIHPPERKSRSNQAPIKTMPLVESYYVPLSQHAGESGRILVSVGDKVLKGQILTQAMSSNALPVHAPTSGKVVSITEQTSTHPSGLKVPMCHIQADGLDTWQTMHPRDNFKNLSSDELITIIKEAGIAGLGGAVFPSHIKLKQSSIEMLIVNGIECEPYITSDDRLMREHAKEILQGIEITQQILQAKRIIVAIEDNKSEAIQAMQQAIKESQLTFPQLQLRVVPTKYPSGGEKQLIKLLTGQEVPSGKLPSSLGICMHNVGTFFAIKQAVLDDKPLIQRVVTVTGDNIEHKGNYWTLLGTPIEQVLQEAKRMKQSHVIMGGPMMGFTLPSTASPVIKSTNCLLAPLDNELSQEEPERDCIRCGECANACPAGLLPQQLFWYAKSGEHQKSREYNLFDCIECGACAYVCPSNIPLVHHYRAEKAVLRQEDLDAKQAIIAKQKFEARNARLEKEKQQREQKQQEAAKRRQAQMSSGQKDAVAAAMARIKKKKELAESETTDAQVPSTDPQKAAVAAAMARIKKKKELAAQQASKIDNSAVDPKKAAVAAAITRAKAKRQQQETESS